MTQTSFFDYPVFPANPFKPESQNYRLYERLKNGPVTNREIFRMNIPKYTGRISEIREAIRPHLMDVKAERGCDRSHVIYRITGVW